MVALLAAMVAATSCDPEDRDDVVWDVPKISFDEDQMTLPREGGEFYIPVSSTGVDFAELLPKSNWVTDENGDLIPIDEWIDIVKVINEYDAEATRALPMWESAILVRVQPNDTGYVRQATLSAKSFTVNDTIIIYQSAE